MNKGLILGMAGLGLGLAVAGGVGGYFIGNSAKKDNQDNTVVAEYEKYDLPPEFFGVSPGSLKIVELSNRFSCFSAEDVGTYFCDKETGKFKFFSSSNVLDFSDIVDGYCYFLMNGEYFYKIKVSDCSIEKISLGVDAFFYQARFLGSNNGHIFIYGNEIGQSENPYWFLDYDIKSFSSSIYKFDRSTSHSIYDMYHVFDFGDCFYFTRQFGVVDPGTVSRPFGFLLKKDDESVIQVNYRLALSDSFIKIDNCLYGLFMDIYNSYFCKLDLTDGSIKNYCSVPSGCLNSDSEQVVRIDVLEKGVLFNVVNSFSTSPYSSHSDSCSTYVDFETDTAHSFTSTFSYNEIRCYNVFNKLVYLVNKDNTSTIFEFDETSMSLKNIFADKKWASSLGRFYSYCGKMFFDNGHHDNYEVKLSSDGNLTFTLLPFDCCLKYPIMNSGNLYLFQDTSLTLVNFTNFSFKTFSNSFFYGEIINYDLNGNIVTLYTKLNYVYKLDLKTFNMDFVGYWK